MIRGKPGHLEFSIDGVMMIDEVIHRCDHHATTCHIAQRHWYEIGE